MKKILFSMLLGVSVTYAYSQDLAATTLKGVSKTRDTGTTQMKDTVKAKPEPFAFGDFTWLNGNDRRHSALLDSKYFTGRVLLDFNYTASNNNPVSSCTRVPGARRRCWSKRSRAITGASGSLRAACAARGAAFHARACSHCNRCCSAGMHAVSSAR